MVSLEDPSFTHCNRETQAVHGTGYQVRTPLADGIRQVTSADHRDLRGGRGCSSNTASVGADSIRPLFLMGISSGGKMHLRVKAQCPFLLHTRRDRRPRRSVFSRPPPRQNLPPHRRAAACCRRFFVHKGNQIGAPRQDQGPALHSILPTPPHP